MVAVLLTMLGLVRLHMHQHRDHLGVEAEDIGLHLPRDGMPLGHGGGLRHLQVEVDLEAVAEPTCAESVEALGAGHGQDVLTEVVEHMRGRGGVDEVLARDLEEFQALCPEPAGQHETDDLVEGPPLRMEVGDHHGDQGEQGGVGVGPVVGGVGQQQTRPEALGLTTGVLVETLLEDQREARDPGGRDAGLGEFAALHQGTHRGPGEADAERDDQSGDEHRREGGDAVMTIRVVGVLG